VAGIVDTEDFRVGERPQPQALEHLRREGGVAHRPDDLHRAAAEVLNLLVAAGAPAAETRDLLRAARPVASGS
jgi:hypothetical protein